MTIGTATPTIQRAAQPASVEGRRRALAALVTVALACGSSESSPPARSNGAGGAPSGASTGGASSASTTGAGGAGDGKSGSGGDPAGAGGQQAGAAGNLPGAGGSSVGGAPPAGGGGTAGTAGQGEIFGPGGWGGGDPAGAGGGPAGAAGVGAAGGSIYPALPPPPAALWSRAFGSVGRDYVFALAPLPDGGVYFAGVGGLSTVGGIQFHGSFVGRFSAGGDLLWARSFDQAEIVALARDSRGDLLVAGAYFAAFDLAPGVGLPAPVGPSDGFVAKLSADGGGTYAVAFSSEQKGAQGVDPIDFVYAIAVGADDQIFVAGAMTGDLIQPFAHTNAGKRDLLFASLDVDGKPLFATLVGGAGDEGAASLCVHPSGNVTVPLTVATPFSFSGQALGSGTDTDVALLSFSAGGVPLGARVQTLAHDQSVSRVACLPDGGIAMIGETSNPMSLHLGLVARFDATGAPAWATLNPFFSTLNPTWPGSPPVVGAEVRGLAVAPDGRFIVSGTDRDANLLFATTTGGAISWGAAMGPYYAGEDEFSNPVVAVNASGEIFYAGAFAGTLDVGAGPHTSTAGGKPDAFIAKLPAPP